MPKIQDGVLIGRPNAQQVLISRFDAVASPVQQHGMGNNPSLVSTSRPDSIFDTFVTAPEWKKEYSENYLRKFIMYRLSPWRQNAWYFSTLTEVFEKYLLAYFLILCDNNNIIRYKD